jgi:VPDSG-CTERM motif
VNSLNTNRPYRGDNMKKLLIPATCVLALALGVTNAAAAPISTADDNYLGSIDPGAPADSSDEVAYINHLISLGLGATDTEVIDGKSHFFTRSDEPCVPGPCPAASETGADSNNATSGDETIDASGFTYLLVKFGDESHVWYIPDLEDATDVDIPSQLSGPGTGASHWSAYNPTTTTTPDGGATLGLLGLGILGLGYLRRRLG